jgi:type IV pilus assembly protein PilA
MRVSEQKGFSLIELLIVVAIILIIAAIAIPNMIASKIAANEAAAVASIRAINTAQTAYSIAYPNLGYADTLLKLADPPTGTPVSQNNAGLIDWVLGCASQPCTRSGYNFQIINPIGAPVVNSYDITAVPSRRGQTGNRGFCGSNNPTIKFDTAGGTNCTTVLQ